MNKAVFLDRDDTVIEDPGYLSDPTGLKLLPGVEQAIKSLSNEGYKVILVTNQSGIARGILTEQTLELIHGELRRQLAQKGAHLDGIYYCPYHPEGIVEGYIRESDWRKPQPGMLLKAAEDYELDLQQSWVVGDSGRDVEAGQRAGCKTIRIRHPQASEDEDSQADHTVRNLKEAAAIILHSPNNGEHRSAVHSTPHHKENDHESQAQQLRMEILQQVRQLVRKNEEEEFSFLKLAGGVVQIIAVAVFLFSIVQVIGVDVNWPKAAFWGIMAVVLQLMALTLFSVHKR